ncbi:autotransporter domain-containing protein [Pseudomonas sp. H9]|uniref:autotransporter domain-containing protein n=1 Tax=Pseudomonas sp. H9 TaxID=483968 RepID=UPI00105830C5|nr:autotransporter domain-containing protein [Pseudomonas sp. H9]TDF82603.1 autotransporter outer membrane beta-barrel domain-containing protein [Pseudomonas sp. H9]
MDSRTPSVLRVRRNPLSLAVSLATLGIIASLSNQPAFAACTPALPSDGATLTCTGLDQQNYSTSASNLIVNVSAGSIISSAGFGAPAIQLTGNNTTFTNSGQISPSNSGQQAFLTTGLKIGNSSQQNISITNNALGWISGTGGNLSGAIANLNGMAIDAQAGAGGTVTIVNNGIIFVDPIVGATLAEADMPNVAVHGGAQVNMTNTHELFGRVAFEASAPGNTFTNSGSFFGSLSMGAGSSNTFNAITGSEVRTGGATGTTAVTVDSNPNLVFAAPGIIDGGAGGNNTLSLQNAIGGGSGTAGSGSISATSYRNFSNLLVKSGTWQVSGALLTGATTSANLTGGSLTVDNGAVFGSGNVSIDGGTLIAGAPLVTLGNAINLGAGGLTVKGNNSLVLNGVIAGTPGNSGTLTKIDAGSLTLNGANTYSGSTVLAGGTLTVGNNQALGTGVLNVTGAATLASTQAVVLNNALHLNSNLTVAGGNDLRLNGPLFSVGSYKLIKAGSGNLTLGSMGLSNYAVELNSGSLTLANNGFPMIGGTITVTGDSRLAVEGAPMTFNPIVINSGVTLDVDANQDVHLLGVLSGDGNLTKTGQSNLSLYLTNTLSGLVNVQAGSLATYAPNALGNNSSLTIASGAIVALNADTAINALSGSGELNVNGAISLGGGNASSTFAGAIAGASASTLNKVGTGTLTLAGVSSYSNNLTVSAGRLHLNTGASIASNLVTVQNGASISGTGTFSGNLNINGGGRLLVGSGGTMSVGSLNLNSGSIVDVALGAPSLTPLINVSNNLVVNDPLFNFTDLADIENGTYHLISNSGATAYLGATLGTMPSDFLPGEIVLQFVAGGINVIVNSQSLLNQYWDGGGAFGNGVVNGGSGVWNSTATNWTKASGNPVSGWKGAAAVFQGSAGQVTIEGTQTASSLQFKTDGYILSTAAGGQLGLVNGTGGSALVTTEAGVSTLIDGQIGGSGKLEKAGAGTLVLAGNNLYTGGTALNAGTLTVRSNMALGSGLLNLASGTTLRTDTANVQLNNGVVLSGASSIVADSGTTLTLNSVLTGVGGLVKLGAGTLVLNGNNNQLGTTWLNDGGLVLGSNFALGLGSLNTLNTTTLDSGLAGVVVNNSVNIDGNLTVLGSHDLSLAGMVSGSGNLIKSGASTLSLSSANALSGGVILNQGTLRLGHNSSLGTATLQVNGASTLEAATNLAVSNHVLLNAGLTVSGANDLTLSGLMLGTGGLIKDGSGTLTLNGPNLLHGYTELKAGTLMLGTAQSLGFGRLDVTGVGTLDSSSALTLANNVDITGALTVQGSNNLTLDGAFTGTGSLTKVGSGTLTLNGNNNFYGVYNVNDGLLLGYSFNLGEPSAINVASGATLQLAAGGTTGQLNGAGTVQLDAGEFRVGAGTFSGALTGFANLYKRGGGTLLLSGNSTLGGATTVADGTLQVDGSLGNSNVSVLSGATLTGHGVLNGAVTVANGGHLGVASGSVLSLGSLVLNGGSHLDAALGAVMPGAVGLVDVTGNLTLDGQLNITDSGGFGIGVYRLFDYGGALTDNGLVFANLPNGVPLTELDIQTSLANQVNLVVGGAGNIRFWDGSELTGNGSIDGGGGVWNANSSNWTTVNAGLNGAWNNSFAVFGGAAGTVTVDGTQSVTGLQFLTDGYVLNGGTAGQLQLLNGGSGHSAVRVDNGNTATLNVSLGGPGTLTKLDNGTLVLNGANTYLGGTHLNAGTLVLGNNAALGGGALSIQDGATLDSNRAVDLSNLLLLSGNLNLAGSHDLALNGPIVGNGGLVKNGNGTLLLNGANSYNDSTVLNAGKLVLGHAAGLGLGQLSVGAAASLDTTTSLAVNNAIDVTGNLTLDGSHDLTLSGALSGNGTLVKQGSSTLDLAGNNTFNGLLQIDNGRLNLLGSNLPGAAQVAVGAAGSLGVGVNTALGQISGQGSIALQNNSLLSLAGGNFAGAISGNGSLSKVSNGNLNLSGISTISGSTAVTQGSLTVNGQGALTTSSLTVANGASLGGNGTINSAVSIADGGHLLINSASTLTTGNLSLNADSNLDASLGAAVAGAAGMLKVNGDLLLDGKLNITDIGGFGLGVYRLIDYTGSLTNNGLLLGNVPSGDLQLQTTVGNQVNLLVTAPGTNVQFWDGAQQIANGAIDGGSGTWGSASNWTNVDGTVNQPWTNSFAVFQGSAGTVTVNGEQTVTGLQFASNGYRLQNGTAGSLKLVNGTLGNATVRVDRNATAVIDVALTGSGTLGKYDSGTLVLNGANSYSGGTLFNGGTLVLGNNAALGSGSLTAVGGTTLDSSAALSLGNAITLNGALTLAGSHDLSLSGVISGSGSLIKQGATSLTLSGDNTFSGALNILDGNLILVGNNALGNASLNVSNNAAVSVGGSTLLDGLVGAGDLALAAGSQLQVGSNNASSVYDGNLNGTGSLLKAGTGKLVFNGNSSVGSGTQVNAGSLIVGGAAGSTASLASNVQVASGAMLGGHGSILGRVDLARGATLNPGNSIGTLRVDGDVNLAAGSTLEIEANPDGRSDKLISTGTVSLGGANLKVLAGAGDWAPSTSYGIVQAAAVNGTFAEVSSNLAFLTPELAYSATGVQLTLERNGVSFVSAGRTFNQRAAATGVESLASGKLYNVISALSVEQAQAAYDSLSGELHASTQGALFDDSRYVRDTIGQRLRAIQGQAAADGILHTDADSGVTFWLQGYGGWGDSRGNSNTADMDHNSNGTLLGVDLPVGEHWRVGVAAGYGTSKLDVDARNSSAEIDSTSLSLFAAGQWDAINLRLGASQAWSDIDSSRHVQAGSLAEHDKASYDAKTTQVYGELGYAVSAGDFKVEPFVGLAHVKVDSDSFQEHGGSTALQGKGETDELTYSTLGVHASTPLTTVGSMPVALQGTLGWQHAYDDLDPQRQLSFAGSQAFTVKGTPLAQDTAAVQLGVTAQIASGTTVDLGYSGQFGDGYKDNGVRLGLNVSF